MTYRNEKLLKACRSIECVNCGADDGTIVAAHQNEGKGMGLKAPDSRVMSLCFRCHSEYDQGRSMTRDEKRAFAWEMMARTLSAMVERGILEVKRG